MEKYIVCTTKAGLGNRIKGLVSAIRIGRRYGRKILLYWPVNFSCGCEFEDLFENKFEKIDDAKLKEIPGINQEEYLEHLEYSKNPVEYLMLKTWKFISLPGEAVDLDFAYKGVKEEVKQEVLSLLNELVPIKEIRDKINGFLAGDKIDEMVGVHIRRGDTRFSVEGKAQISSEDKFIKRMKEFENERFFLSTDSEETEKRLKEEFGDRVIVFPKGTRDREEKTALQEALIDMLLLGKTKHILGSYLSTFTEIAWWFGDCKAKVEIVGGEEATEDLKNRSKIITKIKFYKTLFLRWLFGGYK